MKKIYLFLVGVMFCSCASQEKFVYFQPDNGEQILKEAIAQGNLELTIEADHLLAIVVTSSDVQAANPYNLVRSDFNTANIPIDNFLVDKEGNIVYPGLGKIGLEGLTITEAKEKIQGLLEPYLKEALVDVRLLNFKITVLGEVRNPSSFVIDEERITILEALGLAGDLSDFAERSNIMIIREQGSERNFEYINLLDQSVFKSNYFYLKPNDVVYVPTNKKKAAAVNSGPLRQIVLPVLSVGISLTTLIILTNNR